MAEQNYNTTRYSCGMVNEMLGGYLNDSMPYKEKEAFQEHLTQCANCSLDVKIYNNIKQIENKELFSHSVDITRKTILESYCG